MLDVDGSCESDLDEALEDDSDYHVEEHRVRHFYVLCPQPTGCQSDLKDAYRGHRPMRGYKSKVKIMRRTSTKR
jgi:hypothetical protein